MNAGDVLEVKIEAMSFGGEGIARHEGFVVFVPRGVRGDVLRVRIIRPKKRYASARIERIITPSPLRTPATCPLFSDGSGPDLGCGGCQWMHIDYDEQKAWKKQFVADAFDRIGKIDSPSAMVSDIVGAESRWASRNKLSATVSNEGEIGLCIEHSREILGISRCPMETEANNTALESLGSFIRQERYRGLRDAISQIHLRMSTTEQVSLCIYASSVSATLKEFAETMVSSGTVAGVGAMSHRRYTHLAGDRSLYTRVGRIDYELPIDAFFQTHYSQAEKLLEMVISALRIRPGNTLLDLYAGVGFFALAAALDGARVTAIEEHPAAIAAARRTAKRNRDIPKDGNYIRARVDEALFSSGQIENHYDLVVLDPPRTGCGTDVARRIAGLAPSRIVYVSCSPPTLARDTAEFTAAGYRIESLVPIDMFPQTYHVEAVAVLAR